MGDFKVRFAEQNSSFSLGFGGTLKGDPGEGYPPGGLKGDVLVKKSAADGDAGWQRMAATDEETLRMFSELGVLPAVTSGGAILTNRNKNILLW